MLPPFQGFAKHHNALLGFHLRLWADAPLELSAKIRFLESYRSRQLYEAAQSWKVSCQAKAPLTFKLANGDVSIILTARSPT